MMENIKKYSSIILLFMLFSCNSGDIWLPVKNKRYSTVLEMENDSLNVHFANYLGFTFSLDSIFLKTGFIDQNLNLGDVVTDKNQINEFKTESIQQIIFTGKGFDFQKFESLYKVDLKKKKDRYIVYNEHNEEIGYLKVSEDLSYEFTISSAP